MMVGSVVPAVAGANCVEHSMVSTETLDGIKQPRG